MLAGLWTKFYSITGIANLYALRLLKKASVQAQDMLRGLQKVMLDRSWNMLHMCGRTCIPVYLSERIESVQKRAFKIIYPDCSYNQALILGKETMLSSRREFLCNKLMDMNKNSDHPLFLVSAGA